MSANVSLTCIKMGPLFNIVSIRDAKSHTRTAAIAQTRIRDVEEDFTSQYIVVFYSIHAGLTLEPEVIAPVTTICNAAC